MPSASASELPLSTALSEASPDSLSELFSRDPEHFTDADLDRIILALREQRARYAQAEATGARTPQPLKLPVAPPTPTTKLRI